MKYSATLFLTALMIALSACSGLKPRQNESQTANSATASAPVRAEQDGAGNLDRMRGGTQADSIRLIQDQSGQQQGQSGQQAGRQRTPMEAAGPAQVTAQAAERKIIRNAELTIETDSANEGQRKIATISEKHGGFVVISESRENDSMSQTALATTVNIVLRVPAQNFDVAIEEIRGVGGRILHEKRSGQDVTEEYIDLEARLRSKRALEAQFLEIMKQARKVSDALEVQTQLANVRVEIEQIEGRRRFLENQSALSTINITLRAPTPVVAATTRGFFYDLKAAFGDGVDVAAEIVLGVIRFAILMVPITLFILLPAWFGFKWLRRRISWPARAAAAHAPNPGE